MTSKEALERLKDDIEINYLSTKHSNEKDKSNYLILLNSIEKDLEILEILKKHYDVNFLEVSPNYFIAYSVYKDDEDFKKVKEWLENDID